MRFFLKGQTQFCWLKAFNILCRIFFIHFAEFCLVNILLLLKFYELVIHLSTVIQHLRTFAFEAKYSVINSNSAG